jgi:hypothetical protein
MNVRTVATIMATRPRTVILLFTIVTVLIGLQAQNLYMETDFANYLSEDNTNLALWEKINEEFNLGSTIIILVNQTGRSNYQIRDYEVLKEMDAVCRVLYDNPQHYGKNNGISSINSLSYLIREENDKTILEGGNNLDDIPQNQEEIYEYMERPTIQAVKGVLYTNDYSYAVIIIQLEDDADFDEVLSNVETAVNQEGNYKTNMYITGTLAMQKANQGKSMQNFVFVFPVALLFTSIVLFYFHRSFKGIIIAFLPIAFALMLTFGTLGAILPQLTIISVSIVALLMGLGVDYSIYLMNRMTEEKDSVDDITRIEKTLKSTGKAVVLSTITTFIGFSSLMISSMFPMVAFGFGCAIGILFAFLSSIIIVPCLVVLLKFDRIGKIPSWSKFAKIVIEHRKRIILIAIFFAILSVIVIPQIKTDVNYYDMTPSDVPELDAMLEYGEKFGSGGNFNAFLVETEPYGLEDPLVINQIIAMEEDMRGRMGNKGVVVTSIADSLKEVYDIIDRNTILDRFNNLTDLDNIIFDKIAKEGIVNKDHSKTLILVTIPIGKSIKETESIIKELNQIAAGQTLPRNGRISELAGQDAVYVAVNNKLKDEQSRSMIIALILVLAVLIIVFNSTKYGLLTMIPVIFVLMWEPGFLVTLRIPLSPVTITIASIMIGVGIDYGVHITHRFREELAKGLDKNSAIQNAIEKTGLSLVEAAITTSAGVAAIIVADISALNEFVVVIIFMVAVSCIAAAMILPAFLRSKIIKVKDK